MRDVGERGPLGTARTGLLVAGLFVYPVKGFRGIALDTMQVERCGPAHDRRWAVVRPGGRVLTQRDLPGMARIDAYTSSQPGAAAVLRLEAAGHGGVDAVAEGGAVDAEVWRTIVPTVSANAAASAWLSRVLGADCRLVWMADPASRPVTPDLARPGDVTSLADGFPFLVTGKSSLDDLNRQLDRPVPMDRFRPNLVIAGAEAWAEDQWSAVTAGAVRLRLVSACARCTVTTLDQRTGEATPRKDPLRTLGIIHRNGEGAITFGLNAVPETLGTVQVGDDVMAAIRRVGLQ